MQALAKFHWDCGRQGSVDGLFVVDKSTLEAAYGKDVYFGEILGKHSEIYGTLDASDITIKTEDQEFIAKLVEYAGSDLSGYNPLDYLPEPDEDDEDDEDDDGSEE